jgi:hypothetical protein
VPALYRVFPFAADAAPEQAGGAFYVPPQSAGRIDNPDLFSVLYLSDAAAGAIAEAFGRFPEWTPAILAGSPALPGSVRAIARYHLPDSVQLCDLDDPGQLLRLGLRPSEVVSRDYARTRAWARGIYGQQSWAGIRWWSYYEPRWASLGLWELSQLRLEEVRSLRLDDAALLEAARTILRRVIERSRG